MSELDHTNGSSPFDVIRIVTQEGREYWSARELMPLLGYERWERFADAIARAKIAAHNSGVSIAQNFPAAAKVSGSRGPTQLDYHLSRYACYLVAMSGDSRKREVAAALTYFAIRTREAETRPVMTLPGRRELAQMVIEAEDRADREAAGRIEAEQRVTKLEPSAAAWDELAEAGSDYAIDDAAKVLSRDPNINIGERRLFAYMQSIGWVYRGHRSRWRVYQSQVDIGRLAEKIGRPYWCTSLEKLVTPDPTVRITSKGLAELYKRLGGGTQLALVTSA